MIKMFSKLLNFIYFLLQVLSANSEINNAYECVEYIPGNINLILTVPHGGYHELGRCPIRKNGCIDRDGNCYYDSSADCDRTPLCPAATVLDTDTQEMGPMIASDIEDVLGKRPHLVIMKCSRKSVDVNRDKEEAAQNCADAEAAWEKYHNTIEGIIDAFEGQRGLLLDFHGQSHKQNSTEFGYAVLQEYLDIAVADADHEFPDGSLDECSITALLARLAESGFSSWDVLAGQRSFGLLLENEGFAALPGPTFPKPGETNYKYFNGGYTVRRHGSKSPSDTVDAIQMETPSEVRFEGGADMQRAFSRGLSKAIVNFFKENYN